MGAYTAFLDLSLGITGPALGLVAGWADLKAVFLASTLTVACAALIALRLMLMPRGSEEEAVAESGTQSGAQAADVTTMETF